jgi:hypothetical protein
MSSTVYSEAFKEAANLAKLVPEAMQAAAFDRALSLLLGESSAKGTVTRRTGQALPPADDGSVTKLLADVDRTAHPEVTTSPRVLERAMLILRIAKDAHGIDGLTAPEIARVLTDKFRKKTSRQAVQAALDSAADFVDRIPTGGRVTYRIMHDGEVHLKSPTGKPGAAPTARTRKRKQSERAAAPGANAKPQRVRARGDGVSRKALIVQLINDGFFATPQVMGDICDQLSHKKGHSFQARELSATILRLLRDGVLDRDRNKDGQYAYRAKAKS